MWPRLGDSSRGVPVRLWINTAGGVSRICLQAGCRVWEKEVKSVLKIYEISFLKHYELLGKRYYEK